MTIFFSGCFADPLRVICYFLCAVERIRLRELRQSLSVYLRRVKAGQRVEVTERGRRVARLEPIADEDDPIARLAREPECEARHRRRHWAWPMLAPTL